MDVGQSIAVGIVVKAFASALGGLPKLKDWISERKIKLDLLKKAEGSFLTRAYSKSITN